jgi:predicted nucleic acid-binding protein
VRSFFDTRVLVYTDDRGAAKKRKIALDLFKQHLRAGTGVLSMQVLQECFAATRKLGVDPALSRQKVDRLHRISFWDGRVVRAAQRSGCRVLLSEDLQAGRAFEGLEIRNPFA